MYYLHTHHHHPHRRTMPVLDTSFKAVSLIFAVSAIYTGAQAVVSPNTFARSFGIEIAQHTSDVAPAAYVSLMGVRQLGTGLTIIALALQGAWKAIATNLAVIGFVVAGTDGLFLAQTGSTELGVFHALPGALIASLSILYVRQRNM
jgi:hypothetical protein